MQSYHETPVLTNPYAYEVIPPIGRLLEELVRRLTVGGCFRPGNRTLAGWAGYKSASQIPYLLSQLACDGWIDYDPESRLITLLRTPGDQAIRSTDRRSIEQIESGETALIHAIDRDFPPPDAEAASDQEDRSIAPRMEDSCLAAADPDLDSAAARYKLPCAADSISAPDRPVLLLLAELGTSAPLRMAALATHPDLTPEQVRATWAHFEPRIAAGLCTAGAFHAAIARGELHTAPPDPDRPLDPAAYAGRDGFQLGSQAPPDDAASIRDHAASLLPPPTADTHRTYIRDWLYLQGRLGAGDTDAQALAALAAHRKAVGR